MQSKRMIRNEYSINTQSIRGHTQYAIRKSIRIDTHVYAIHIRNSQYAIAQNVNTHDTQIPFSIRIHTHPYAVGSLLMLYRDIPGYTDLPRGSLFQIQGIAAAAPSPSRARHHTVTDPLRVPGRPGAAQCRLLSSAARLGT